MRVSAAWLLVSILAGCSAVQRDYCATNPEGCIRTPEAVHRTRYAPIDEALAPFSIDYDSTQPLRSKHIGLAAAEFSSVQWLMRPQDETYFPRYALVINAVGNASGMLLLVSDAGDVVGYTEACGMIQEVSVVHVAPLSRPQLLVIGNTGRGSGFAQGNVLLLDYIDGDIRVLLDITRLIDRVHEALYRRFAMPLVLDDRNLIVLILECYVRGNEDAHPLSASFKPRLISAERYTWSRCDQKYVQDRTPVPTLLSLDDLIEWTGSEYNAGE